MENIVLKLFIYRSGLMEIIDLKKHSNNKLLPVNKYGNVVFLSEDVKHRTYPCRASGILNYYLYYIDTENIKKIDR